MNIDPCSLSPRSIHTRHALVASWIVALMLLVSSGHAGEPSAPSPAEQEARALFEKGVARAEARDWSGALAHLLRSRALWPSGSNTFNAALCLHHLERYDEALDLYEVAVARYPAELTEKNKAAIAEDMASLSKRVLVIELSGNIQSAELAVDGKLRRDVPDLRRLRLLPGAHVLRLVRSGFSPLEVRVAGDAGQRLSRVVQLKPIGAWLRVEAEGDLAVGATIFLDGGSHGATPWEGQVRAGMHVIWIVQGDIGSPLTKVNAVEGEITNVILPSVPLGVETQIEASPATAELEIDGIVIAHGSWTQRLPIGSHTLIVSEPGYRRRTVHWTVAPRGPPAKLRPKLDLDAGHPRWPKQARGSFSLGDFVGYAVAPSLGSDAEASCAKAASCSGRWGAGGPFVGLRAGYEFPFKLSLEVTAGATRLQARFTRHIAQKFGPNDVHTATYHLDDHLTLTGPFAALGVSQRFSIGTRLSLMTRLAVGAFFNAAQDPITGTAEGGGQTVRVTVFNSAEIVRSVNVFLLPEVAATVKLGPLDIGGALAVGAFLVDGPKLDHPAIYQKDPRCASTNPDGAGCVIESSKVGQKRAYGPFVAFVPQINIRYVLR